MFFKLVFHRQKNSPDRKRPLTDGSFKAAARERMNGTARRKLLLPGALLVTIQAQLLAPFMFVDLGLAAFFD
jgi:hypothetical protein